MLGNLHVTVPSFLKITTQGLRVTISNVFLCFEMLEVDKWNEQNVKNKYQNAKKASLKTHENNVDVVYAQYQKDDKMSGFTHETLLQIAANVQITVENVFLMFQEPNLKFSIGLLLPEIKV